MVSNRGETAWRCPRSVRIFSPSLLFLSLVLPASSYAQIINPALSTTISLTTLQTSAPSSSSPASTSSVLASTTRSDASTTPPADPDDVQDHVFNYYFLIIGVVAMLFCICVLYIGRRKKQKAALLRSQSQRALATDVAGFRARFGSHPGRTNGGSYGGMRPRFGRVEGLNERGEAPPPYVPGPKPPKPPSVRVTDELTEASASSGAGGLELDVIGRPQPVHQPPKYNEHIEEDDLGLKGSNTARTTNERPRSTAGHEI